MSQATRSCLAGWIVFFFVSGLSSADEKKDSLLPRSIYVPIEFELCEHLHEAVLYLDEQPVSYVPAKRIFQFTYYPALGRIEPARTDVEVAGTRDDGEPFLAKLAVTPWGIFTADHKVDLDLQEQLERMRYKIDVRYQSMPLKLRCADSCEKASGPVATTARNEPGADTIRK